jgi:hypothetical protein
VNRRAALIVLLAAPLAAHAQSAKPHWVEGQNITLELRWAEGDLRRLPALAEELVRADRVIE